MARKPTLFEDIDDKTVEVDEFIGWCGGLEWATASLPDSRDVLLKEVVKRAKKLLDRG
jgi:hypothetical protein